MEIIELLESLNSIPVKWISWVLILVLSLYFYIKTPLRFSNTNLFSIGIYNFNYSKLFNILKFGVLILNLMLGVLLSITNESLFSSFKYWYFVVVILVLIILFELKSEPVIDDGSFNRKPKYVKKSYKSNILIIFLLFYHLVGEFKHLKSRNMPIFILWSSIIVNILINIIFLIKQIRFSTCAYNLPKSWS